MARADFVGYDEYGTPIYRDIESTRAGAIEEIIAAMDDATEAKHLVSDAGTVVTALCRHCGVEIVQRLLSRGDTTWFHNASFANVDPECDGTAGTYAEPTTWEVAE